MHFDDLASLLESKSEASLSDRLAKLAQELGFGIVSAHIWDEVGGGDAKATLLIDLAPESYRPIMEDNSKWPRCPVFGRVKVSGIPFSYDQGYYAAAGAGDLWEEQAQFGLKVGLASGLHLPRGRHFLFGVDGDGPLPQDEADLSRLIADFQLLASYACEAAVGIADMARGGSEVALTDRQVEVLGWTSAGKTAWEIGQVMSINERTVVAHLSDAMRKLDCVNKTQAVSKALRLELIK